MGLAENRARSQAHAQYMKDHGISRRSGACPWGCGAMIPNGGGPLLVHLGKCLGGIGRRRAKFQKQ